MLKAVTFLTACFATVSAFAITNGVPAGRAYPEVILITSDGGSMCSSVLVGRDTLLTAQHCAFEPQKVSFNNVRPVDAFSPDNFGHKIGLDLALLKFPTGTFNIKSRSINVSPKVKVNNKFSIVGYGLAFQSGEVLKYDYSTIKRIGKNRIAAVSDLFLTVFFPMEPFKLGLPSGALPGDSGGPMLNSRRQVIGIASSSNLGIANYTNLTGQRAKVFLNAAIAQGWDINIAP